MLTSSESAVGANIDQRPEYDVSSDQHDWVCHHHGLSAFFALQQAKASVDDDRWMPISSFSDLYTQPYVKPEELLAKQQARIAQQYRDALAATMARIRDLKVEAQAEQLTLSTASERDLLAFLDRNLCVRRPYIALLDNGNLRALWKRADEQIGLQFRGDRVVHYVLFARRLDRNLVARSSGRDTLANISRLIDAHGLGRLMTE